MYAIVHKDGCSEKAAQLEQLGYTTLVLHTPVQLDDHAGATYAGAAGRDSVKVVELCIFCVTFLLRRSAGLRHVLIYCT